MREPMFKIEHKKEIVNGEVTKDFYVVSVKCEEQGFKYRETALSLVLSEFIEFQELVTNFKPD